jgi:hypothetical protein
MNNYGSIIQDIMAEIKKEFTNPIHFVTKIDDLFAYIKTKYPGTTIKLSGELGTREEEVGFANLEEFREILDDLGGDNLTDYNYFLRVEKKKNSYTADLRLQVFAMWHYGKDFVNVRMSNDKYIALKAFSAGVTGVTHTNVYVSNPELEKKKNIKMKIKICTEVLERVELYQSRLRKKISDEKEFQDFLFPVLKAHFNELVDESGLPKFTGVSYRNDFGVLSLGLIIECKYLRRQSDFDKFRKEIADDLLGYFFEGSPYTSMTVVIYNSSNKIPPNNYIRDLEKQDKINRVIITPGIDPIK